jgi:translation initiation factor 1
MPLHPLPSLYHPPETRPVTNLNHRFNPTGLQQRNGRKTLTTVQGLPDKYDPKKLLKAMKKEFACNGHVVASADDSDDESTPAPTTGKAGTGKTHDFGRVLQFQGDQRMKVKDFLVSSGLVSEKEAKTTVVM